ncbi:hypothetical protein AN218_30720 [Streptomyces nanshensis]|uniref:LamG-like jellyroll fold domain-containing protein n=2 Tax=Streptomyces nanshensis TaxID=518642 RepID=A0A1E7KQY9_9ACTN|nr:hypothetical protein AN218_30720 [Streptomyces nanshensis]
MDCVRLTDAELLRLIREGGEPYFSALHELEQRHFHPVRSFASACAVHATAADDMAYEAWQEALRQRVNGSVTGAVRPCVLSSVLRTASAWVRGSQRPLVNRRLADWIDANGPVMLLNTATAGFRRPSLVARAYANLSYRSQTIVWHRAVEHEGSALTGRLTGVNPAEVPEMTGPAQGELYYSYIQVLQDAIPYECRPYHQLLLAYVDGHSGETSTALTPHLEQCRRCAQAVSDLGRLRHDCGALLAESLLPWGGAEYAAGLITADSTEDRTTQQFFMPGTPGSPGPAAPPAQSAPFPAVPGMPGMPGAPGETPGTPHPAQLFPSPPHGPAPAQPALPALPAAFQPAGVEPGGFEPAVFRPESPLPAFPTASRSVAGPAMAGKGRHAAADVDGNGLPGKGRRRTDLVVKSAAVAGVCAVAAAFAVVGPFDDDDTEPQAQKQGKQQGEAPAATPKVAPTSSSPSPTKSDKATARPKPTATKTRPEPKPTPTRTARPSVKGASVAWLFNDVDGDGVTPDSSSNNRAGTLFGASRPTPTKGGGLAFDGQQFVASSGPLINTSGSFSVSARVKLNRTDVSQTVVSQDASDSSGFSLQYDADEKRWEMRMPTSESDPADADGDEAVSVFQPRAGQWTQLTGVYDDENDQLRLYVDGRLNSTAEHEDDFESDGIFAVGRGLSDNKFFQGLQGTVDEVRAFDRALSTAEARTLARKS